MQTYERITKAVEKNHHLNGHHELADREQCLQENSASLKLECYGINAGKKDYGRNRF